MKIGLLFYMADGGGGGQTVTVGADDSILSIAKANGLYWSTVWNHPNNASLKAERGDPEVLQEGDQVFVPKAVPKQVSKPNEATHVFQLKGEQAVFKMQLMQMDEPRANEPYTLVIDGTIINGTTDGNGMIQCDIPNDAKGGVLKLQNGKEQIPISIGRLDPADSPDGVRQRLKGLGFEDTPEEDAATAAAATAANPDDGMPHGALKAFQTKYNLTVSGELDDATKAQLKTLHPA